MRLTRRTFVQLGTAGAAGLLAACKPNQPAQPAQSSQSGPFRLTIAIGGGFAMVFSNKNTLACGSIDISAMAGCHAIPHVATLRLVKGKLNRDTSNLPNGLSSTGERWWIVAQHTNLVMAEGGGTNPIQTPRFNTLSAGSPEDLAVPASSSDWNWHHTFTPVRHHQGANLLPDWRQKMDGIIELHQADLTVLKPSQECAEKGRFGSIGKKQTDAGYMKTITDSFEAKAISNDAYIRFYVEGAPTREIVVEPVEEAGARSVALVLAMEQPQGQPEPTPFSYKVGASLDHLARFYGLVSSVQCTDGLIPSYLGFPEGANCTVTGKPRKFEPGGYCPGGTFVEP